MKLKLLLILFLCYLGCGSSVLCSVRTIRAVNDGEKVERDDLNNPNKHENSAWDGHKVKIFGAGNEIIAFPLIIETDHSGIERLAVTLPQLAQKGARIVYLAPAADPTYYSGRPI